MIHVTKDFDGCPLWALQSKINTYFISYKELPVTSTVIVLLITLYVYYNFPKGIGSVPIPYWAGSERSIPSRRRIKTPSHLSHATETEFYTGSNKRSSCSNFKDCFQEKKNHCPRWVAPCLHTQFTRGIASNKDRSSQIKILCCPWKILILLKGHHTYAHILGSWENKVWKKFRLEWDLNP